MSNQHKYEETQDFNFVTRFLHKSRYKYLLDLVETIAAERGGKTIKIVDVGCGTAKVFSVLDAKFDIDYLGIELNKEFCDLAEKRYGERPNFRIICDSIMEHLGEFEGADLVVSLECLEHIPERFVVRIIEAVADADVPRFYCTVPNEVGPAILIKNVGSFLMGYIRHREYAWRETLAASVYNLDKVGLHGTGHKGFDWRWLAQTVRHNMKIDTITTSPHWIVPRSFSPSIGFVCTHRETA